MDTLKNKTNIETRNRVPQMYAVLESETDTEIEPSGTTAKPVEVRPLQPLVLSAQQHNSESENCKRPRP